MKELLFYGKDAVKIGNSFAIFLAYSVQFGEMKARVFDEV